MSKYNPKTEPGEFLYYLIQTTVQGQGKAVTELRRLGFRAYMPIARTEHIHKRSKKLVVRKWPLLDRYIFVRVPRVGANWYGLLEAEHVEGVMSVASALGERVPFPIHRGIIAAFLGHMKRGDFDDTTAAKIRRGEIAKGKHAKLRSTFAKGRNVRVQLGPFAGFSGRVTDVTARGSIRVLVGLLGAHVPLEFSRADQLAPLDMADEAA